MGHSILIVDDSATTRAMIKRIIRMAEIPVSQIHEAVNGAEALALLAGTKVDLILADLNMPVMDGFEMTRQIRGAETTANIPIVVISASPSAEDFSRLERTNGCLTKPFTPEAIRDLINKTLEVQHA